MAILVKPTIDTMRAEAGDLLARLGWLETPRAQLALHQVQSLMAEFGMRVHSGEVGCGWPECGCCDDAVCGEAVPHLAREAQQ